MSSGRFLTVGYERDNGDIHPIRLQPETTAAVFAPGGANAGLAISSLTNDIQASARGSKRAFGLRARYVVVEWDVNPPVNYTGLTAQIPVPNNSVFASIQTGGSVTYLGTDATVRSKVPESPFA